MTTGGVNKNKNKNKKNYQQQMTPNKRKFNANHRYQQGKKQYSQTSHTSNVTTHSNLHKENNFNLNTKTQHTAKRFLPNTILTSPGNSFESDVTQDSDLSKKLSELKKQCEEKDHQIKMMQIQKKIQRKRKKKAFTQLDWQIRNVTKLRVFRRVKFITSNSELDAYERKGSLGHYFFKCFTDNIEDASKIGNKKKFWDMAKLSVYDAICEKRNAVHSAMKKKFLGEICVVFK